jgi:O-methyltransferase
MKNAITKLINKTLTIFGLELRLKSISPPMQFDPQMPVEANEFERNIINECGKFSMTGSVRMWALIQSMKHVRCNNINGAFVECGVWKGGNLALMHRFCDYYKIEKTVLGYDTFEGMPEATSEDINLHGIYASDEMNNTPKSENAHNIHAYVGLQQVEKNLKSLNCHHGIQLIKGRVEDTLMIPENLPTEISILRLDTDWYDSTKIELEVLFPRLARGGILIIDDYGHFKGAQKAVDEYFRNQNVWLHYVDYTCRLMIKS